MDFFVEPSFERPECALRDLRLEVGQVLVGLMKKLGRVQVAQRVGREIPQQAAGPVRVLEHAMGIVGRTDAQVLLHPLVPRRRQLRHGNPPLN